MVELVVGESAKAEDPMGKAAEPARRIKMGKNAFVLIVTSLEIIAYNHLAELISKISA